MGSTDLDIAIVKGLTSSYYMDCGGTPQPFPESVCIFGNWTSQSVAVNQSGNPYSFTPTLLSLPLVRDEVFLSCSGR